MHSGRGTFSLESPCSAPVRVQEPSMPLLRRIFCRDIARNQVQPPQNALHRSGAVGSEKSNFLIDIVDSLRCRITLKLTLYESCGCIPGTRRRIQPPGWDAAGRPDKIHPKCFQHKIKPKFCNFSKLRKLHSDRGTFFAGRALLRTSAATGAIDATSR